MLIGEAPGYYEDQKGEPFVGKAGQLLDKIFASVGLSRQNDVYICNTLKCRPPDNRDPLPEEKEARKEYLNAQIEILKPPTPDNLEPWVRLTNDVAVNLANGFVSRPKRRKLYGR